MATQAEQWPDEFKCPISLEIMSDPVILSSGHTFDRSSIQRWLDAGHRTCPISKLPLSEPPSLIPNHALRSLISKNNLVSSPSSAVQSHRNPDSLIQLLVSKNFSPAGKLNSLDRLVKLCKRDSSTRRWLTESGAVSVILDCVKNSENSVGLQEKALYLLLSLSLDDDNKVGLVAEGIIGKVVAAVQSGSGDSRAVAATIITSLAVLEVNKVTIGSYPDAISGLIGLLRAGNHRERKEAATALFALCSFADNRVRAVENRAVPILIQNLSSRLERAVEVLGLLAKCKEGREEMLKSDGLVENLMFVLLNGSSRGVQYGLLTLNLLCSCSEKMCLDVLNGGVFEACLELLDDENEKVRRNADNLMQVLDGKTRNVF